MIALVLTALVAQFTPAGPLTDHDLSLLAREAIVMDARREAPSAHNLGASIGVLPDPEVARAVQSLLENQLGTHLRALSVSSAQGRVTIQGEAATEEDRLRAAVLADGVVGARQVVNQLSTPDSPAESWSPPPLDERPGYTEPFSFLTKDGLAGAGLVVRVENGIIFVEGGVVGSERARDYVTAAASFVPNTRIVRNKLQVLKTTRANDDRMAKLIYKRLSYTTSLHSVTNFGSDAGPRPGSGISVAFRNGVATITGRVDTPGQIQQIEEITLRVEGVLVVDTQLQVGPARDR